MKAYKTLQEAKRELKAINTWAAGTDKFLANSMPLLIEEIQVIRRLLADILYELKPPSITS